MDFVSARLADGRWFRTLPVLDVDTREGLALVAGRSLTGIKVAAALTPIVAQRGAPTAITVDNGGEFVSRAMDAGAYAHDVRLEFIRPGKPVRLELPILAPNPGLGNVARRPISALRCRAHMKGFLLT
jgi:putative transposase